MLHVRALLLALVALATFPDVGNACWRRKCRPYFVRPCPVIVERWDARLTTFKGDLPEFVESARLGARAAREADGETFTVKDHHRGLAKTTFANAPLEEFTGLRALILSLPRDEYMVPRTGLEWDFDRIAEERRNVRVTAYLFAIKKEADNDYHLIIDDDGNIEEGAKFNVEVSGIPDEGPDGAGLRQLREHFHAYFAGNPPKKYQPFLDPPVRVIVEGSLFFDRDHPAGAVGPQGYRPASAWEIHPIRRIEFLGN